MALLLLFAFLSGIVTIVSPCVLPVLPVVLSQTVATGRLRPLGVVAGFTVTFVIASVALTGLVAMLGIPAESLRYLAIAVIALMGLVLLVPAFSVWFEQLTSRFSSGAAGIRGSGFWGGLLVGAALGAVWTPCVGPIMAAVLSLAVTGQAGSETAAIAFAYALGTAVPMFAVMWYGRSLVGRISSLLPVIQKGFGILMIVTSLALATNLDRKFQTWVLTVAPGYGAGITAIEDVPLVRSLLTDFRNQASKVSTQLGLPTVNNPAPALVAGGQWFNTAPLTIAGLKGKVVLLDFWTYTCINCIRTLPYVKSWYAKYKDKGLVVIGVHTPEFEFEKNPDNVKRAIADFGITYPVMQDNDYATWDAYNNHYWPAKYFIDKNGTIRSTHFGEGNYDESEMMIRTLLAETGAQLSGIPVSNPGYAVRTMTPESYLGFSRMERFVSPERIVRGRTMDFSYPDKLELNDIAFRGSWEDNDEFAHPYAGSGLKIRFAASRVFLVMRPDKNGPGHVQVLIDGKPAGEASGNDVHDGVVTVDEDRLYDLVRYPDLEEHELELIFTDGNVDVFAFTFG